MGEAKSGLPDHLASLADTVLPRLPRRPRASQNLRAITLNQSSDPTLLDDACTNPWLAFDSTTHRNALLIDIDHVDSLDRWLALPEAIRPMLVLDPWSGRAHAVALLDAPVLLRTRAELEADKTGTAADVPEDAKARLGPQMMADLAGRLLAAALGGSLLPAGSLTKNPWGRTRHLIGARRMLGSRPEFPDHWQMIQEQGLMWYTLPGAGPVELRDIVRSLSDTYWHETASAAPKYSRKQFVKKRGDASRESRNRWVFDLTRWWAYDHAERDGGAILDQAMAHNAALERPLPGPAIRATARSITRYMNSRYRPKYGSDSTRGRDRIEGAALDAKGRQALAGQRSAAARANSTDERIATALAALRTAGCAITQAALAAGAGLSLRTVKARWRVPGMVQDGVLSGSAAGARPEAALQNQNPYPSSLAGVAARDRAIQVTVGELSAATATMRQPGARPISLPTVPDAMLRTPAVWVAHEAALAARRDAARRQAARHAAVEAQERAAEMRRQAAGPDEGRAWWKEHLADLSDYWEATESEHADDPRRLAAICGRRDAVFIARAAQWKRARAAVRAAAAGTAPHVIRLPRLTQAQEDRDFQAQLDGIFGVESRTTISHAG